VDRTIKTVRLDNFLSFGPESPVIDLKPLNVLVGANGAGKSNFLEAFALLKATPTNVVDPIRDGGGAADWIFKGPNRKKESTIEIVSSDELRYKISFSETSKRFEITDELIENAIPDQGEAEPYFFYKYENNHPVINVKNLNSKGYSTRGLKRKDIDPEKSILAQRKDPDSYPELTKLGEYFSQFQIYRNWTFGRYTSPRLQQPSDLSNKWVSEDARNLGLVLNRLRKDYSNKSKLTNAFANVYDGAKDFDIQVESGNVQIYGQEKDFVIPATRLSDGTLHYLFLMAILSDPEPPPMIIIEEPELGLHPDLVHQLADALKDASTRTQIVVTTHSAQLIDCFSSSPEDVLVFDKKNECTNVKRLDAKSLEVWLKDYSLGELWLRGDIGGVRW